MSAFRIVRPLAVIAITVTAAIGFFLGSFSRAGSAGPPFVERLWAEVEENGTLVMSSRPGITVAHNTQGVYRVDFGTVVQECVSIAAPTGSSAGKPDPGTMSTFRSLMIGREHMISVIVRSNDGTLVDRAFTLQVLC